MLTLRLGSLDLPAEEIVLLKALMRLLSFGESFTWKFVNEPPFDALVVDETTRYVGTVPASAVLRLVRSTAPRSPNTLARPLRAHELRIWLSSVELSVLDAMASVPRDMAATEPAPLMPASGPVRIERPLAQEPVRRNDVLPQRAPAQVAATPASVHAAVTAKVTQAAQEAAALDEEADRYRYRLLRWPPTLMLRKDPGRVRLATLMSRQLLTLSELVNLSRLSAQDCQTFIQALQSAGLLARQEQQALSLAGVGSSLAPQVSRQALPATARRPQSLSRSLIAGIRRSLGI